jgi:uncharacterized protein involved in exopolysaccharide biosynthesis
MQESSVNEQSSFINLVLLLNQNKTVLVYFLAVSLSLALVYNFSATKTYQSKAIVSTASVISAESATLGQLSQAVSLSGLGVSGPSSSDIKLNIAIARMESKFFLNEFLEAKGLKSKLINENRRSSIYEIEKVAKKYFSVTKNKSSGLITLTVAHHDPEIAFIWASEIIPFLNNQLRKTDIAEGEKNIFYLQQQLSETNIQNIKSVFFNIIEQQVKKIMLANVREDYFFEIVDPAAFPESNISPNLVQSLLIGLFLGLALGILYILIRDFSNNISK